MNVGYRTKKRALQQNRENSLKMRTFETNHIFRLIIMLHVFSTQREGSCLRLCGCRVHAMRLIITLLQRIWQRGPNAIETDTTTRFADHHDRSSMADFVRILQAQDRQQSDHN
jgi:hypothetical protein